MEGHNGALSSRNPTAIERKYSRNLYSWDDPLKLQGLDHLVMVLVTAPLIGNNFRSWSPAIKIALGAKQKLGFTGGTIQVPYENSEEFEKWKRRKISFIVLNIQRPCGCLHLHSLSQGVMGGNFREIW